MKSVTLIYILPFLFPCLLLAQSPYESGMQQGFELWGAGQTTEAIALFERIGQAETDNWIPLYHAANVLISTSFNISDKPQREAMLKQAKVLIATAHKRSPSNAELLTLEGFLYTTYVVMDPDTYGMQYSPKILALHDQALAIDPDNPRALLHKIEYELNTARFFGQDLSPFCERMQAVIPIFQNQQPEVPFAPSHGIERAQQIIDQCDG